MHKLDGIHMHFVVQKIAPKDGWKSERVVPAVEKKWHKLVQTYILSWESWVKLIFSFVFVKQKCNSGRSQPSSDGDFSAQWARGILEQCNERVIWELSQGSRCWWNKLHNQCCNAGRVQENNNENNSSFSAFQSKMLTARHKSDRVLGCISFLCASPKAVDNWKQKLSEDNPLPLKKKEKNA